MPPRKPILGKWSGEGERKLRYYVDQDDPAIPVGEVTDARLQLKIPHTGIDDRLLPELHDTTIVIRPRKSPDDPPGSPLADAPRPKARTVRVPKPKLGDDPVIPRNMTKTRSSSIIMAESDAPSRDFQEDEMVVEKPALVATAKRKRGRPPKSSYEQATPISFEPGVSLGDELLSSDPIAPSDSEVEEDEDPDYGSPGRKRSKAARTAKKKSSSRSRMRLSGGSESFAHYESGYDHAGLGPSSSRRTPSPRRRLGDAAMSQVYPDEVPVNLATALLEELDELPAVADAEVPQTQMVYLAASPPAKQVDVTTAAVWLVELGRVSQPPTPIVMALDSASKEALGAGSRSASSPTLNHAPLVKVEDRRNSLGQMELPSSKLYSLTSPLRQGSEPIPATPPSKFLMDTSTAVTPIAHATSIVVGMDTTKVLKWTYKQEWLDTVKRTEPASSDDLQVEVGAPVPPYKSSQLRQSPLSSRLLSDEHMSDRGSSRSARSSAPGTPGQNLDQIRKPPHFLFDEMDMDHSSQAKDTVGTLDSPTLIRENAAISGIRRQRSRGFNADHGSYGSRGFPSSMGEDDEAEDALIVGTTSSRPSSTYTDIRVGFVSVPDPEPILQSIRRGEEKITRTTSTAVDWRSVLFPESASLPILDQVAQGRQRGQASASGKKAAGGKTSSKPTSPPPRGSASGNEATAGRSLKSHGGGAGGNDGDDEGDGRRRRSPHELPKISAPDDDATDEEEEPEVTTEPLKRESRSPRKATNASPQKERRARSSSRSAATMPTPEPTPGRTPRKNDTSTEVLASVIELKHVEVLPENRLQVVSFYEMDLPGKGASDDSPIRFAKIKVGMLTGILPIRLASSGRLSGEYELNIDLANFVNVAVFFGFPLADMSTISSTVLKCWTAFQAGSWMDSRPMSPKDSKSSRKDSRPIAALEVALLEGTDAADICEENAALFVSGSGLDLQDGEVVDPALIGLWIPMRYAAEIAQRLPQPLPDQLADLITVDDEDLATTTDEDEEERLAASDGDIDLPEANAALLAAMVADSSHDHGSSTGARPVGSKIAQILPPASATLLMDLIAGQQGKGKSKADHPRPSHSKKPVKSDLGNFSPTLRELFADDDAASLFSGDDTMSYFNLSSDGEDGEEDLNLSDLGEISDGAMDELDGGLEEWRRSKEGSPAVEDRTAKLAEAGLPNFAISSLDLQSAAFSLPPPSGPIWKTSIDGVEVYLTLLPRPRSRTTSGSISQPQTPTRGDTGASAVSLMGAQIPIIRRVDDGTVNATTLLLAGGLVSDRERTTVLSLELVKTKTRRKPGLAGTWIPLKRARELSRTYLLEGKLAFFLSDGLSKVFSGAPSPSRQLRG